MRNRGGGELCGWLSGLRRKTERTGSPVASDSSSAWGEQPPGQGKTEGLDGFVAADLSLLAHDVLVEPPAGRPVQGGDGADAGVGCFLRVVHEHHCKTNSD